MLDRGFRWEVRKELMGCRLAELGFAPISELKEIFERYAGPQGGPHRDSVAPLMGNTRCLHPTLDPNPDPDLI